MDFMKFFSFLSKSELFFSRSDLLGDRLEGSVSKKNIQLRKEWYPDIPEDSLKQISSVRNAFRFHTFINCWHMNSFESDAMWQIYASSSKGIAIQSTIARYKDSIIDEKYEVYIGQIEYIDFDKDPTPEGNLFFPYFHKRRSYEHEKEIRGFVFIQPESKGEGISFNTPNPNLGLNIRVDQPTLVEKIYLAPNTPEWQYELVKTLVKKFEHDFEIKRSNLEEDPVY